MLVKVEDASAVSEVRRRAAQIGRALDLGEHAAGRAGIVATELATNIVRHARRGEVSVAQFEDSDGDGLELLALDGGPGIADIPRAMADGYSTAGSAGEGLGAVRRLADVFGIYSRPGQGTAVLARIRARPAEGRPYRVGAVVAVCPGEEIAGDDYAVAQGPWGAAALLADGSGHGPYAAEAARAAVAAFTPRAHCPVERLCEDVHRALRPTRGAAVAVTAIAAGDATVRHCGIGNISGTILGGDRVRKLVSENGVAGHGTPRIRAYDYPLPPGGTLVLHSDGLATRWDPAAYPGLVAQHPAVIAGVLLRDFRRGRDDATVLVLRREAA